MKKIKYEKPIVRRLGYDSEVVAGTCLNGAASALDVGKEIRRKHALRARLLLRLYVSRAGRLVVNVVMVAACD